MKQRKEECEVDYEIYIDSLFLVNFVMNLYLLCMVNILHGKAASYLRLILGAAFGAAMYCVVFLMTIIPVRIRVPAGIIITIAGMLFISFPIKGIRGFFRVLGRLLVCSFLMGGVILFMSKRIPFLWQYADTICLPALAGALIFFAFSFFKEKLHKKKEKINQVFLYNGEKEVQIMGFFDTGNRLQEPISQKPVSVVSKKKLLELFDGTLPELYRVVPYKSIGKNKGILYCYEILEMRVNYLDMERSIKNVWLAYSEEYEPADAACQIILNPELIKSQEA